MDRGFGVVGGGSCVRDPHTKLTRHIYIPFMLFQTAVSYQLSLNFHNTSKFVALTKKKKKNEEDSPALSSKGLP